MFSESWNSKPANCEDARSYMARNMSSTTWFSFPSSRKTSSGAKCSILVAPYSLHCIKCVTVTQLEHSWLASAEKQVCSSWQYRMGRSQAFPNKSILFCKVGIIKLGCKRCAYFWSVIRFFKSGMVKSSTRTNCPCLRMLMTILSANSIHVHFVVSISIPCTLLT